MTEETIKALAQLPLVGVLIYLLVRSQTNIDSLMKTIIESEREHAKNLVQIICSGRITADNLPSEKLEYLTKNEHG